MWGVPIVAVPCIVGLCRWCLLPPEHTHLFVDSYGQLPADFWQQPEDPAAAQRWEQGRTHILQLVQVCPTGSMH
jgi:hypothetical protein